MGYIYKITHVYAFPYLGNGWTDCTELWFELETHEPPKRFTQTKGGVDLHVLMCVPHISEMVGRIALSFGMWIGDLPKTST